MLEANYTQIPNPILDTISKMSESELKLTMCLVRYTFGYQTDKAQMTYEIMQERTGMSRGAVYRAIELVENRGFFRRGRKSFWFVNRSEFELCYVESQAGKSSDSELKYMGKSSDSEPTKRKSIKKDTTAAERVMKFYQNNIGGIGRDLTIKIKTAVQMHTEQTVLDAMQEAIDNNVLKWNYIDAILRNWEQNGRVKPSLNGSKSNDRIGKNELKDNLWTIVTRSKDYQEAQGRASPDEWEMLTSMGKWRDVRGLNETTFSIRFYEVYKQHAGN